MRVPKWTLPLLCCALLTSCDDKETEAVEVAAKPPREVPAKPPHGSPVAAEFDGFTGEGERGIKVHLYNFGDKPAVQYTIVARYYDEAGTLLKVQPGTPFEDDTAFTSLSGNKFRCNAKEHAELELDGRMMNVPAKATRADLRVTSLGTLASDGMTIEDWWSKGRFSEWPEDG